MFVAIDEVTLNNTKSGINCKHGKWKIENGKKKCRSPMDNANNLLKTNQHHIYGMTNPRLVKYKMHVYVIEVNRKGGKVPTGNRQWTDKMAENR